MEEEDGYLTSDAEPDSDWEIEESDTETELELWLEQLNSFQQEGDHVPKQTQINKRTKLTSQEVVDSFRSTLAECNDRVGDTFGLDAILGELCDLESQLTTTQTEINSSLNTPDLPKSNVPSEYLSSINSTDQSTTQDDSFEALDLQLQSALSELSEIAGGAVEDGASKSANINTNYITHSNKLKHLEQIHGDLDVDPQAHCEERIAVNDKKLQPNSFKSRANGHLSDSGGNRSLDKIHEFHIQASCPNAIDADSAFSDSGSLPSSGSHLSVTTTSSLQSGSSAHSASAGITDPVINTSAADGNVQEEKSENSDKKTDQAARLKAEKVRIALEKIKEANIKKLFIRAFTVDGSSKSILIDEKLSVSQVCDILVTKNHAHPSVHWSLVEHLPDLYMERILEDQACLVGALLTWARDSNNKLLFEERPEKYNVFIHPELYLTDNRDVEGYTESSKQALIKEYFSNSNTRIPEVEGLLHIKSEGKKAWKKVHCVLRASGIYYTPKGKGKSSKDLVCLQKLDIVEVYSSLGWKKKYKAPTDYGFALKHQQIQRKGSKYIKYLCADEERSLRQWMVGIRMAKLGQQLLTNYELVNNNLASWDSQDHNPNPIMSDYLENLNKLNNQVSFSDNIQHLDQSYNNNNAFSDSQHQDFHAINHSHYSKAEIPTKVLPSSDIPSYQELPGSDTQDNRSPEYATMSPKMRPFLPVTTTTLRQLTEVNQGTIKRSPKIYKKCKISPRKEAVTGLPLPPEPVDEIIEVTVEDGLPPPPSMEDLRALQATDRTKGRRLSTGHLSHTGSPGHSRTHSVGGSPHHAYAGSPRHSVTGMHPVGAVKGMQHNNGMLPRDNGDFPQHSHSVDLSDTSVSSPHHPPLSQPSRKELRQSTDSACSLSLGLSNSHSVPGSPAHTVATTVQAPPIRVKSSQGHRRTSSVGNSRPPPPVKPKPPPPPKRSGQTHLSKSDSATPVEIRHQTAQTTYFITDLQRVLGQKHDYASIRQRNILDPTESFPPPPPPQILPSSSSHGVRDDIDDLPLPPPPAELLEDLRKLQNTNRRRPPPPPKRSSDTKLSTKK